MACDPSSNYINIPIPGPPETIPGLGLPFSIPKYPIADIKIPTGIPEDITALINTLTANFPFGIKFNPNPDSLMKNVMDGIASLLTTIAPFLGFYKFIQALLDMILCILDVICALLNPFALPGAVNKLFKQCIPNFLSMFPYLGLLIMILSIILLLVAVIEFIIAAIIDYVNQVIENLKRLAEAFQRSDSDGALLIINKIAYVLCLIQNLFSILIAFQVIIAIIKPLLTLGGVSVCSDKDACCGPDFCPEFIKNNPNFVNGNTGKLQYLRKIVPNIPVGYEWLSNVNLSVRSESWQFFDETPSTSVNSIITPSSNLGLTYWPDGENYESDYNINKVPYLIDITCDLNPTIFHPSDTINETRKFNIKDIIVKNRPTNSVNAYNNIPNSPYTGTFQLGGGTVWEFVTKGDVRNDQVVTQDGYVPYLVNGVQANLETFIHMNNTSSDTLPLTDDGYYINNITYNWKWNKSILVGKQLTSIMCNSDLAGESAVLNAEFADHRSISDKLGENTFPDIDKAINDLNDCLTKFRSDLNEDTANVFLQCSSNILNNLKTDSENFYCAGVKVIADRYTSDFNIDTQIQFTTLPIKVTVVLKDKSGSVLASNINDDLASCVKTALSSSVTFGKISEFVYDGQESFTANITSEESGTGTVKVYLSNEVFSKIVNRDNLNIPTELQERYFDYEFIGTTKVSHATIKFDESDVAADGEI